MEPLMRDKREVSSLVPFRVVNGVPQFFLQMRDEEAPTNPNKFGLFGGGFENEEGPESALRREIGEELTYTPAGLQYFSRFETDAAIFHVFIEEVGPAFEASIDVREGKYGKFLTLADVMSLPNVTDTARLVVIRVASFIAR